MWETPLNSKVCNPLGSRRARWPLVESKSLMSGMEKTERRAQSAGEDLLEISILSLYSLMVRVHRKIEPYFIFSELPSRKHWFSKDTGLWNAKCFFKYSYTNSFYCMALHFGQCTCRRLNLSLLSMFGEFIHQNSNTVVNKDFLFLYGGSIRHHIGTILLKHKTGIISRLKISIICLCQWHIVC